MAFRYIAIIILIILFGAYQYMKSDNEKKVEQIKSKKNKTYKPRKPFKSNRSRFGNNKKLINQDQKSQ